MLYTSFAVECAAVAEADPVEIKCDVKNTGAAEGDEVLMLMKSLDPAACRAAAWKAPVPLKALVDFDRVSVLAGETATLTFTVPYSALALTSLEGDRVILAGDHTLGVYTNGTTPAAAFKITVAQTKTIDVVPRP